MEATTGFSADRWDRAHMAERGEEEAALPTGFLAVGEDLGDGDESSRLRAVIQIYWWYSRR